MADDATGAGPAVGERIRRTREERGLSVRELAARSALSAGLISQVERGITDPSLQTLRVIAKVLNTPLFDFFADTEPADVAIIRSGARMAIRSPHGGLTYERLSPGSGRIEVLEGVLRPGACSSEEPWSHPSEECVVVTAGELVVEVRGQAHRLGPGDSCYFDSRLPHRYLNEAGEPTRFTLAITPPSY
ncbi:helix-turn-helix transcriptional regulator [Pseudonocardia sp. C8]|uniref:helix-turn-helix domain-containing protein n=1 Tax=Pseudonocardia sp. C8 TaxID=2762759 RepID=UPI0016426D68|nr:XRE family transcriptional regulator [Pseudonocardia sp. C8]MBC3189594.1 helix-turn-helix transcriptional regulator [Pseudonocardia sp. C8]